MASKKDHTKHTKIDLKTNFRKHLIVKKLTVKQQNHFTIMSNHIKPRFINHVS